EGAGALAHTVRSAELGQLGHLQSCVAARVDAAERLEIERHIQRQPVIAAAAAHAHADARELAATDVHPWCLAPGLGGDAVIGWQIDDGALERAHELPHAERGASQVDQRVDHELSRAMGGDLPAAIDLHHRDAPGREQVRTTRADTEREYRAVLEEPDL